LQHFSLSIGDGPQHASDSVTSLWPESVLEPEEEPEDEPDEEEPDEEEEAPEDEPLEPPDDEPDPLLDPELLLPDDEDAVASEPPPPSVPGPFVLDELEQLAGAESAHARTPIGKTRLLRAMLMSYTSPGLTVTARRSRSGRTVARSKALTRLPRRAAELASVAAACSMFRCPDTGRATTRGK